MTKSLFALVLFAALISAAFADMSIPTLTYVYFENNGTAYDKQVDFTINCFGYSYSPGEDPGKGPGTYEMENVFSFSETCPGYGCKIYQSYYLNYKHIDYCDLEGKTEGEVFNITNYSNTPVSNCTEKGFGENFTIGGSNGNESDGGKETMPIQRTCYLRFDLYRKSQPFAPIIPVSPSNQLPESKKGLFESFIDTFVCFFKKLFGRSC